jgi:hypothetical protein
MNLRYKFEKQVRAYIAKSTYIELNYITLDSMCHDLTLSFDVGINFFNWKMSEGAIFNNPIGIAINKEKWI